MGLGVACLLLSNMAGNAATIAKYIGFPGWRPTDTTLWQSYDVDMHVGTQVSPNGSGVSWTWVYEPGYGYSSGDTVLYAQNESGNWVPAPTGGLMLDQPYKLFVYFPEGYHPPIGGWFAPYNDWYFADGIARIEFQYLYGFQGMTFPTPPYMDEYEGPVRAAVYSFQFISPAYLNTTSLSYTSPVIYGVMSHLVRSWHMITVNTARSAVGLP